MRATAEAQGERSTQPITWPPGLYALIELGPRATDRLAVCIEHDGAHVRYIDWRDPSVSWCQALPPHQPMRRTRCPDPEPSTTVRVEIDEDRLGQVISDGVVAGFRRARAEQRQERRR